MGKLLSLGACALGIALAPTVRGDELGARHEWTLGVDLSYPTVSTELGAWVDGGAGKLRFDADESGLGGSRIMLDYRGHVAKTLWVRAVVDYVDDASSGIDLTEAYLDWRPLPRSRNQYEVRFGALYPPFSLENGAAGWESPFTTSFSAINTWYGEEIRPAGAEGRLRRQLGGTGSPHEISAFAATFYGDDPAGTLLFWRGFSLHDRQTRFGDRLPMPPGLAFDPAGAIVGLREQYVEPVSEIDHGPGYYAGFEWRYARRALVQLATYDNRADPTAFTDGQWAWHTRFRQLAFQLSLPAGLGLVSQWLDGETYWLTSVTPLGATTATTYLAEDDFESKFALLTRRIAGKHSVSLRYDTFDFTRKQTGLNIDSGDAWTLAYRYRLDSKLEVAAEWLTIDSRRDLWPVFYGVPEHARENQFRVRLTLALTSTRSR
jgi:hypothetical protein